MSLKNEISSEGSDVFKRAENGISIIIIIPRNLYVSKCLTGVLYRVRLCDIQGQFCFLHI